jgi:three-Cys-motif partner protein
VPRSNPDEFFETREDWSRRKHLILEQYLPPATAKLRKASPDGRVVILDGFAGRGRYEDGTPGSPVQMGLLAGTVRGWRNPVNLRVLNVEADAANYAELQSATQAWVEKGIITNYHATFRAALLVALQEARSSPLFAFLDPFRPTDLPFDDIAPLLTRNGITEVLLVFHTPHVSRIISQVHPQAGTSEKTRAGSRETLNAIFGGNHWERFLTKAPTPEGVIRCFLEGLAAKCQEYQEPGRPVFLCTHPIEARFGKGLKYHVVFLTRHPDGIRLINDAFVKERRDVHGKSAAHTGQVGFPFDEFGDPHDATQRPAHVRRSLIEAGRQAPDRLWTFEQLMLRAMMQAFGQFSETEYKQAARELLNEAAPPRLVGVEGDTLKSGKWKVEDRLRLRVEL